MLDIQAGDFLRQNVNARIDGGVLCHVHSLARASGPPLSETSMLADKEVVERIVPFHRNRVATVQPNGSLRRKIVGSRFIAYFPPRFLRLLCHHHAMPIRFLFRFSHPFRAFRSTTIRSASSGVICLSYRLAPGRMQTAHRLPSQLILVSFFTAP